LDASFLQQLIILKEANPMLEFFFSILAALFSIVNPMGAVPVFLALTPHYTKQERNRTSLMTSIYFILILMAFFLGGTYILSFFGISLNSMRIAGGVVILLSGYSLLNGQLAEGRAVGKKVQEEALTRDDISFSPMAIPMLSGPGSISLLISLYTEYSGWIDRTMIGLTVIAMGGLVYLILRFSPLLFKILGVAGLKAMTRIMGFIVMAIGIQYIISGIVNLVKHLA
jgi:multiple antibiotic resistance protein